MLNFLLLFFLLCHSKNDFPSHKELFCISFYFSVHVLIYLYVYLSVHLSINLFTNALICIFICPIHSSFIYLFICVFINLLTYLRTRLFIVLLYCFAHMLAKLKLSLKLPKTAAVRKQNRIFISYLLRIYKATPCLLNKGRENNHMNFYHFIINSYLETSDASLPLFVYKHKLLLSLYTKRVSVHCLFSKDVVPVNSQC